MKVIGVVAGSGDPFNPAALIGNSAKLQGLSVGSRDMFEAMCRAIDLHKIAPVVDKVFPLQQAAQAHRYVESGAKTGAVVITVP